MVMEGVRGGSGDMVTRPALDGRWRRPLFMGYCGGADGLHVDVVNSQRERGGCGHWVLCPHKVHVHRAHHAGRAINRHRIRQDNQEQLIHTFFYGSAMYCMRQNDHLIVEV